MENFITMQLIKFHSFLQLNEATHDELITAKNKFTYFLKLIWEVH